MYSRPYYDEGERSVNLPDNYMGVAFSESVESDASVSECSSHPEQKCTFTEREEKSAAQRSSLFGEGSIFANLKLPEIGLEEILIIATAAFLFISKDGDRECAVMLLLLLLVN